MAQDKTYLVVLAVDSAVAEFEHGKDPGYGAIKDFYRTLSRDQRAAFDGVSDFWAAVLFRIYPEGLVS